MPTDHRPAGAPKSSHSGSLDYQFAPIPAAALRDTRLHLNDIRALGVVLIHARNSDRCAISNATGADYLGIHERTFGRCLDNLAACGYLALPESPVTALNRTGRAIVCIFKTDPSVLPPAPDLGAIRLADGTDPDDAPKPARRPRNRKRPDPAPVAPPAPVPMVDDRDEPMHPRHRCQEPPAPVPTLPPAPVPTKVEGDLELVECRRRPRGSEDQGDQSRGQEAEWTDGEIEALVAVHRCIEPTPRTRRDICRLVAEVGSGVVVAAADQLRDELDRGKPIIYPWKRLRSIARGMHRDGGAPGRVIRDLDAHHADLMRRFEDAPIPSRRKPGPLGGRSWGGAG